MFVKPHIRKSLLAKMLSDILDTRVMVKCSMKEYKDDPVRLKFDFDCLQKLSGIGLGTFEVIGCSAINSEIHCQCYLRIHVCDLLRTHAGC